MRQSVYVPLVVRGDMKRAAQMDSPLKGSCFFNCAGLGKDDCFAGAHFGARTAFYAGVGVDVVDFSFGDCFNGANGKTCAASYAVVGD